MSDEISLLRMKQATPAISARHTGMTETRPNMITDAVLLDVTSVYVHVTARPDTCELTMLGRGFTNTDELL